MTNWCAKQIYLSGSADDWNASFWCRWNNEKPFSVFAGLDGWWFSKIERHFEFFMQDERSPNTIAGVLVRSGP